MQITHGSTGGSSSSSRSFRIRNADKSCFYNFTEHAEFLLYLGDSPQTISGLPYNSDPSQEGLTNTIVPVSGIQNIVDFDYDSENGMIYVVQYSEKDDTVG